MTAFAQLIEVAGERRPRQRDVTAYPVRGGRHRPSPAPGEKKRGLENARKIRFGAVTCGDSPARFALCLFSHLGTLWVNERYYGL